MIALFTLELRRAVRRTAWPVTLVSLLGTVAAFVAIWGPTSGLPIWTATLLSQTSAAARVALAVFGTWCAAHIVAFDDPRATADWSLVSRQPVGRIQLARTLVCLATTGVAALVTLPALWRATALSGATAMDLAFAIAQTVLFGLAVAGITAAGRVFLRTDVGTWVAAMMLSLGLAVGIRVVSPLAIRLLVLAAIAAAGTLVAMRPHPGGDRP